MNIRFQAIISAKSSSFLHNPLLNGIWYGLKALIVIRVGLKSRSIAGNFSVENPVL